ncbi:hypothetical protein [Reichenbachiella versicolor]|uniref:hypothetical protein n=1 Tax=Reichenbachiella versicolor TaxID=1821036 RepID=UPI000D6DFB12|nr:hypothetical protein [Reichenbachiella versicolor]
MNKILNIVYATFFIAALLGCVEDEYVAPGDGELVTARWRVQEQYEEGGPIRVAINEYYPFLDASIGVTSHEWRIEQGNHFLKQQPEIEEDLYAQINSKLDTVSKEIVANVLFSEPGDTYVRLYNTYKDSVASVQEYSKATGEYDGVFSSEFDESLGLWIIDTAIAVKVYDTLKAEFAVFFDGEEVLKVNGDDFPSGDPSDWITLDVQDGDVITFVDMSVQGEPSGREWIIGTEDEYDETTALLEFAYSSLGTFQVGSFRTFRNNPKAEVEKFIPLIVNVSPSTKPLVSGSISVSEFDITESSSIVSIELNGAPVVETGDLTDFSINISNSGKGYTSLNIIPTAFEVENSIIHLTLDEPIYFDDDVKITYSGTGITNASGLRTMQMISDVTVTKGFLENQSTLSDSEFNTGFEMAKEDNSEQALLYNYPHAAVWKRVGAPGSGHGIASNQCIKTGTGGSNFFFETQGVPLTNVPGSIASPRSGTVKFYIYIDGSATNVNLDTNNGIAIILQGVSFNRADLNLNTITGGVTDSWVEVDIPVTFDEDGSNFSGIRCMLQYGNFAGKTASSNLTYYVDDFQVYYDTNR